jgi:hypothetical protein
MDTILYTVLWHDGTVKAAENPNIRITPHSKSVLRALAKQAGKPMQAVLDEAIEHYQRDKFLDEMNAAFTNLRNDPKAWKEEQAERAIWDKTLGDGE